MSSSPFRIVFALPTRGIMGVSGPSSGGANAAGEKDTSAAESDLRQRFGPRCHHSYKDSRWSRIWAGSGIESRWEKPADASSVSLEGEMAKGIGLMVSPWVGKALP